MSKNGLGLCLLGGIMYIIIWIIFCTGEISQTSFYEGACIFTVHYLIVGAFGIIGAIIGWKSRKEGYILSIGAGIFYFIYIIILGIRALVLNFFRDFFIIYGLSIFSSGVIFILIGGIIGYKQI